MSSPFHNPYHFVPYSDVPSPESASLATEQGNRTLADWPAHLTHDRFVSGSHSGRLVCRATICELLAVGGEQKDGDKARKQARQVSLFQIGGEWALPGSALRGLTSSLAEAASNSALRVLENTPLSISDGKGRPRTQLGHSHDYFPTEQRPLTLGDQRQQLSLAEQLFGVVEDAPPGSSKPKHWQAFGLASRVRFSNALPFGQPVQQQPQTAHLQILASPKSQSHNLYYQPKTGPGFIPKTWLNSAEHQAKGRKFYLHRPQLQGVDFSTANRQENADQKADVRPLTQGEFWFHLDFDNLSTLELQLLCYALQPSSAFRHKLGMAKPLGLGKLKLEPMGLFLIDRAQRYAETSPGNRYHHLWREETGTIWPPSYEREATATGTLTHSPAQLAAAYRQAVPQLRPILDALELVGTPTPAALPHPVHYPQVAQDQGTPLTRGTPAFEARLFKWFVENDKTSAGQHLGSLIGQTQMPALNRQPPRPGHRAAPAQHPPSAPQAPAAPQRPEDLLGQTHPFKVTVADANKGKLRFACTLPGLTHLEGSLDAAPKQQLLTAGIQVGDIRPLTVRKYASASFQLALPERQGER